MTDAEERMGRVETTVGEIRDSVGELKGDIGEIKGLLKSLKEVAHAPSACPIVVSLNLAAARQQGALAVIGVACGVLGGGVVWAMERLLGR